MSVRKFILTMIAVCAFAAVDPLAQNVNHKLDLIESGQAKPGAVIGFTSAELNAWASAEAPTVVPQGFRKPRLELGNGTATAYALVDLLKVRSAAGTETNWLIAKLIEGEKPVKAIAQIRSANGKGTVQLMRVEIAGLAVSGATLDFLIRTFFLPLYPNAKIDEPFELAAGIDHIQVLPGEARVYIKKK